MSEFEKYMHVERFGNDEVEGLALGTVHVFPKIDGTNSSIWLAEDGSVRAGSRNREVEVGDKDNQGFNAWLASDDEVAGACREFVAETGLRLFGEWLVPHTLKSYREDAWRHFYVFDVSRDAARSDDAEGLRRYDLLSYDEYAPLLSEAGIEFIPPIKIITNGRRDDFVALLDQNFYLMPDGSDPGEGIVLKRYDYANKYGRPTWAKIVRNEFRERHVHEMGAPEMSRPDLVEQEIARSVVTRVLIDKTMAKIQADEATGWRSQYIPRLLGTVYHDVVVEELWSELKRHRDPTIDFKLLRTLTIQQIKDVAPEVFSG